MGALPHPVYGFRPRWCNVWQRVRQNNILKIALISGLGFFIAGAAYFYFAYNPSVYTEYFPKCPSRVLFNIYCPGCGSQRALHHLLHFDIQQAFLYNPLMIVLLPLLIALIIQFILRHFFNIYWKIGIVYSNVFLWLLFTIFTLYFILRNVHVPALWFLRPPA